MDYLFAKIDPPYLATTLQMYPFIKFFNEIDMYEVTT
jgi:hypothetical protein